MSEENRVLVLDKYEYGAILRIINDRRTKLLKQEQDTEFITEILQKILEAPTKKQRVRCFSNER